MLNTKCIFKAKRKNVECGVSTDNYYGFCSKHDKTVQAITKTDKEKDKIEHGKKENIIRNVFGRFEHEESHIIFDMSTQKAYGYQLENGEVCELGEEEIKFCRTKGWSYQIKKPSVDNETNIIFDDFKSNQIF